MVTSAFARQERLDLARRQLARRRVERDVVQRGEEVVLVAVDLRPLAVLQGVLDGELVQPQLVLEVVEVRLGRVGEVDPDGAALGLEVVADLGEREPLRHEPPAPVRAGLRRGAGRGRGLGHGGMLST